MMLSLVSLMIFMSYTYGASSSSSVPENEYSRLMVHIPRSLYNDAGYNHREALFGKPAYRGSIALHVFYAQQDLCLGDTNTTLGVPSREIDPKTKEMKPWPSPFILMIDRGGCNFVKKVRNAQKAGAAGVIIADNTCLCNDADCIAKTSVTTCETQEPIMADDGSGADISIPSYLIFKNNADDIKAELMANRPVQIEMVWNLPSLDNRVEYDLWTTPSDLVARDFLQSFKPIAEALGKNAFFTPRMYIYDGVRLQCQGSSGQNYCANLCTNNGRYCSMYPDNELGKGISGADVVRESLRRICIWSWYGAHNGVGSQWWDYVATFNERCSIKPEYFTDQKCIKDAYKFAKINGKSIEQCMTDSGGTERDAVNSKLDAELTAQTQRGVVVIPNAFVNTAAISGALNVNNVFTGICSQYSEISSVRVCLNCASCSDPSMCVKNGRCTPSQKIKSRVGVSITFYVMSLLAVGGTVRALEHRKYKQSWGEMLELMRSLFAENMPKKL